MMTPQDIESMEFAKAVFGGYDMAAVDDFLEQVTADYTALYKDNMVLKGKLKVLVEKVEEYRSTEDAMRMALLTAQKMSDDMLAETKQKCDEMLSAAARDSDASRAKVAEDITQEDMKLEAAKVKTAAFVSASRQIIEQYQAFLNKLDTVTAEYGGPGGTAPDGKSEPEPVFSPEPERPAMIAPAPVPVPETVEEPEEPAPAPAPEPPAQAPDESPIDPEPTPAAPDKDVQAIIDELLAPAGNRPSPADTGAGPADPDIEKAATRRIDIDAVRRFYSGDGETKRMAWDEEDEMTTPRPKFDFSDLRFGSNYEEEPRKKGGKKDKKE